MLQYSKWLQSVETKGGVKKRRERKEQKDNDKKTMTKKTKTKTLILRRRVELRGRGVSRECRRPAQASVQAAVPCKPESAHRVERRESPSKGRAASPGQCPQCLLPTTLTTPS